MISDDRTNTSTTSEVSVPTTPIPLTYVSNSSSETNPGNTSKEVGPSNPPETEDDYYKMLLEDCAKDCVYFDSAPQSVKEMNEEEMPDDSPKAVLTPIPQASRTNPTYDRVYFRNKILDQYPNLYRECSSENFDYYGITDETSYGATSAHYANS